MEYLNIFNRKVRFFYLRKKLIKKSLSIVTNNCLGGYIYHDLGIRFDSPFINMWLSPSDFINFLIDIDHYFQCEPCFVCESGINYPIMLIDDIKIYCQHYKTNEEALTKWNIRKKRFNKDNLYVILVERDGCTYDDLLKFDKLEIINKVVFTHKDYKQIKSSFFLKDFKNEREVGLCFLYKSKFLGLKYYDNFPLIDWINKKTKYNELIDKDL